MDFCEYGGELQVSRKVCGFSTSRKSVRVARNVIQHAVSVNTFES